MTTTERESVMHVIRCWNEEGSTATLERQLVHARWPLLADALDAMTRHVGSQNLLRAIERADPMTTTTPPQRGHGGRDDDWQPGRWWRVVAPNGDLWCETSDEEEAREAVRPGDLLERLWQRRETQWREAQ